MWSAWRVGRGQEAERVPEVGVQDTGCFSGAPSGLTHSPTRHGCLPPYFLQPPFVPHPNRDLGIQWHTEMHGSLSLWVTHVSGGRKITTPSIIVPSVQLSSQRPIVLCQRSHRILLPGISQNLWVGVRGQWEAATSFPSRPLFSLPLVLSCPVQSSSAALYVLRRQDALGTPCLWEVDWLGFSSFQGGGTGPRIIKRLVRGPCRVNYTCFLTPRPH